MTAYGMPLDPARGKGLDLPPIVYVEPGAAEDFARRLLIAHGVPDDHAAIVADALVFADLRGVSTHGLVRLPGYLERIRRGVVQARPRIEVRRVAGAAAHVDGGNGLGFVVGRRAVDAAAELVASSGIGVAGVMRSNHFGMAGYYALRVVDAGMIGIVMTNASRAMPPFGGREPLLGTGPIAIGAPGGSDGLPFLLDMSPTVAARGKIRLAAQHGEQIPLGYALDEHGRPTTDPVAALKGLLLPMGGPKGSGLAMAIDLLAGVITGSAFAGDVRDQYKDFDGPQNVGHLVVALRPDLFLPMEEYRARVDVLISRIHANPPMEGFTEVLMPGEPESRTERKRRRTGIPIGASELTVLQQEAEAKAEPPLPFSREPL